MLQLVAYVDLPVLGFLQSESLLLDSLLLGTLTSGSVGLWLYDNILGSRALE